MSRRRIRLAGLVAQITPENRQPEIDFGPPVGREFGAEGWNDIGDGGTEIIEFSAGPQ